MCETDNMTKQDKEEIRKTIDKWAREGDDSLPFIWLALLLPTFTLNIVVLSSSGWIFVEWVALQNTMDIHMIRFLVSIQAGAFMGWAGALLFVFIKSLWYR